MSELPEAFAVPTFDTLLEQYVDYAVAYVREHAPDNAEDVAAAFHNDSELLAQITQAFVLKRQAEIREQNHQALQMFRRFVSEPEMVELLAEQYGLQRQTLEKADPSAFPPKPAIMESDESLLRRFDLAPFQFHTTGTRQGYKFHALTLGERPLITIETENNGDVVMRYQFPDLQEAPVKDAEARMKTPYTGEVAVAVLSRLTTNGEASPELLKRVEDYLNRDDIAQESDTITTESAAIKPYTIEATLYTGAEPVHNVTKDEALAVLNAFVEQHHRLNKRIDRLALGNVLYELNPKRVVLTEPAADVVCAWNEAPYCSGITIHVQAE